MTNKSNITTQNVLRYQQNACIWQSNWAYWYNILI